MATFKQKAIRFVNIFLEFIWQQYGQYLDRFLKK